VGAELFHVEGQTGGKTDMTKLIDAFRHCLKMPKTGLLRKPTQSDKLVDLSSAQVNTGLVHALMAVGKVKY